jgi:aspartate racemase
MNTLGIIGGIGPESTLEYYRLLVATYRERTQDGSYPPIVINSIDLTKMLDLVGAGDSAGLTDYLADEVDKLARAGAVLGLLAASTPHLVFDEIQRRSPIKLISIVEATSDVAKELDIRRAGLFGTRFTMSADFFPSVFGRKGIAIIPPGPEDQDYIHAKYMSELVQGIYLDGTRDALLAIVDRMVVQERIEGLILGGTELPLILSHASYNGVPFLNTTRIHVERAISEMLSLQMI